MSICDSVLLVVILAAFGASTSVTVVRLAVPFEQETVLKLNNTIEYILEFTPNSSQNAWPTRVWLQADGGSVSLPVLVTARQKAGAVTWQLPYYSKNELLYELERTLCPSDSVDTDTEDCVQDETARGSFTLHVGSTCESQVEITLRVDPARDWQLRLGEETKITVSQARPRSHYYQFTPDQDGVRLVVTSEDRICATISIQYYNCPIAETFLEVEYSSVRMTVLRSGAIHVKRSQYPRGFYIVTLVHDVDDTCMNGEEMEEDWLFEGVLWGSTEATVTDKPLRIKELTLTINEAITREQYAVAAGVTIVVFLAFYIGFGLLLVARLWPPLAKYVESKAVLADTETLNNIQMDETDHAHRQRRLSNATFDSSDASDSDEEDQVATTNRVNTNNVDTPDSATNNISNGLNTSAPGQRQDDNEIQLENESPAAVTGASVEPPPFGLPPQLRLAALARRRDRILTARSTRYLYTLMTVSVFYALPVMQFVIASSLLLNISGSLDSCYYNYLCAHPAGILSDFNHLFSNVGYLLLGALFCVQVVCRHRRRKKEPKHKEYGIPPHYGLLASLGVCLMMVGLLSASYHVCPNKLNFQFDTSFMYVLAVLCMVKIYQSRHPDVNARAHATFSVLAVFIVLVVWGVLGGGALFWGLFTVLHTFGFLLLSLHIYYLGQFRLEKEVLQTTLRSTKPLYTARLIMLFIANGVNWLFALQGLISQSSDFASHLLEVLLANTLMYMTFYVVMKLINGERLRWYAWCHLAAASGCWVPALYFFLSGSTNWSTTPAQSRHLNHECKILEFYDAHDIWHFLSAIALYFSFNAMLTWDDGLSAVKRTEIAVF